MGNQNSSQNQQQNRNSTNNSNSSGRHHSNRPSGGRRSGSASGNNNNQQRSPRSTRNTSSSTVTQNNNSTISYPTVSLVASAARGTNNTITNNNTGIANDRTVSEKVIGFINAGDTARLDFLLNSVRNFDVNKPCHISSHDVAGSGSGNPPLHAAVHGTVNTLELVKLLERHGANLNGLNADGETPLVIATSADREDVVRLLLELGADVDVPSATGAPPLYYALARRCRAVLPVIFLRRPNVNFLTQESESILHAAVRFGDLEIVNAVVNHLRVYQGGRVQMPPLLPAVIEKFSGVPLGSSELSAELKKKMTTAKNNNNSRKHSSSDEKPTTTGIDEETYNKNENDDDDNANENANKDEDEISTEKRLNELRIRKATLNPNSFDDDDETFRRWANTASLCDARSSATGTMNVSSIGLAVHNAINPANSVSVGTRSAQVAHYLASVRTDMMLEEYLDIPRQ